MTWYGRSPVAVAGALVVVGLASVAVTYAESDHPLSPEGQALLEINQELERREEEFRLAGLANPAPKPASPQPPPPEPDAGWEEGILDDPEFPSGLGYELSHRWGQIVGDKNVAVYAGGYEGDPTGGVLVIMLIDRETLATDFEVHRAPEGYGHLQIVAVVGERLFLSSPQGRLSFDFSARRYLALGVAP